MRKRLSISALVGVALGISALTAQAQDKATELTAGLLGYTSTTLSCTGCTTSASSSTIATGGAYAAVGFYLSPGLALEPSLSLSSSSGGGSTSTVFVIGVSAPIYFDKGWGRKGWYFAPAVTYLTVSCTGCTSDSQFGLGAAIGYKVALNANAALRIHASYDYGFESSNSKTKSSTFGIGFGLSAFIQ